MSESSKTVKSFLGVLLLNALLAYPIVYLLYKHFSPILTPMDIHTYMNMAVQGTESIEPPHRYRYFTLFLVKAMGWFLPGYGISVAFSEDPAVKKEFFHFLLVNFGITVLTSGVLFLYLQKKVRTGFAYLGSLFYLFSFYAVMVNLVPMTDASCQLAIITCIVLMERKKPLWFALAAILGMFTRETLLIVLLPWILIQSFSDRRRLIYMVYTVPAILVYLLVTRIDPATSSEYYYQPAYLLRHSLDAFLPGHYDLSLVFHIFLSHVTLFVCVAAFLWIRIIRKETGLSMNPELLLFPFLIWLGFTLGLGNNTGRLVFMAFPAVMAFEMRVLQAVSTRLGFSMEAV